MSGTPLSDAREDLRREWEGNRRLTLRVAHAFPDEELCRLVPVAPFRPFAAMVDEIARMESAYGRGLAEDRWRWDPPDPPQTTDAAGAIAVLERATAYTQQAWSALPAEKLPRPRKDPSPRLADLRVENGIPHRGHAYIHLRLLGIEPPAFWEW